MIHFHFPAGVTECLNLGKSNVWIYLSNQREQSDQKKIIEKFTEDFSPMNQFCHGPSHP